MPIRRALPTVALLLSLAVAPLQAAQLCDAQPCRMELDFPAGGAIIAEAGASFDFGSGGQLELGSGGSIDYGSGGSAEPTTPGSTVPGLSAGGRIVLGPGGSIHFGEGGRLFTGDAGQVSAPDGSTVRFTGIDSADLQSGSDLRVGMVEDFGAVTVEAQQIDTAPSPFHFAGTAGSSGFALRATGRAYFQGFDRNGQVSLSAAGPINVDGGMVGEGGTPGANPGTPGGSSGSGASLCADRDLCGDTGNIYVPGEVSAPGGGVVTAPPVFTPGSGNVSMEGGSVEGAGSGNAPGTVQVDTTTASPLAEGGGAFPAWLAAALLLLVGLRRTQRRAA